ncbi:MAG: HEAT repeat domain-containing protein [Planctomycetes bacterium]|nr:HEAT repeat domain-containing protein [Planctomycetota bacterium]
MTAKTIRAALLKFDVVDSTRLAPAALPPARDAVEYACTGYQVEAGFPRWEGDGGSAYFLGEDAPQRAVAAALDAVERVRLIPGFQVALRTAVGIGEVPEGADLTRTSPPDFNLAGHMVYGDVCPAGGVCLTEDAYFLMLGTDRATAERFAYLGRTTGDGAATFAHPPGHQPSKPGGLRPASEDSYRAALSLRAYYGRPPFSLLRFYALPQFNFLGALDLLSVFTPLFVRAHRRGGVLDAELEDASPEAGEGSQTAGAGMPDLAATPVLTWTSREFRHLRMRSEAPAEPFAATFGRQRVLVLLGDPGAGKSTLLRYLALATAGGREVTRARLGVAERLLPLYATAASLRQVRREHPEDPPAQSFARLLAPAIDQPIDRLAAAIREAAEAGEALFLVDGLDEMPEAADRLAAAQQIEDLAGAWPACRLVVSSRQVGYPGLALPGIEEVVLQSLTTEQTQSLARAFYVEFYRAQKYADEPARRQGSTRGDELARVLADRPALGAFAGNPLLLSLAALVHVQLGELPRYRVKLYDVATETLVSAWAKARRTVNEAAPVRAVDYDAEGRLVLPGLALYLHENCPGGLIAEPDLIREVARRLPAGGGANTLGDATRARDFLRRLANAGSLLVERGAGRWGFLHQTFQEYLVAKCLAAEDRHLEVIGARLYHPRWQEVIQFVAGELGVVQGRSRATAEFVRAILADRTDWRATDLQANVLLAARCLADTVCADAPLEGVVVAALTSMLDNPRAAWTPVERTLRHLRHTPLGDAVATRRATGDPIERARELGALGRCDLVTPALIAILREGKDGEARARAVEALGLIRAHEAVPDLLRTLREDSSRAARRSAADALGELGAREAIPDLLRALREDQDGWTRGSAARALAGLCALEVVPDLLRTLREDTHGIALGGAAVALGRLNGPEAVTHLLQTLRGDKEGWARGWAGMSLAQLRVPEAVPALLAMLRKDKDEWARSWAATALGILAIREATADLVRTVRQDASGWTRGHAALALGELGAQEAIPDLLRNLGEDNHVKARERTAAALGALGAREAIEPLLKSLRSDRDPTVARAAAEALWQIGQIPEQDPEQR